MSEISAGVQILIDQLKTNPDEFFGPVTDPDEGRAISRSHASPKFRRWASAIEDDLLKVDDPREKLRPVMGRTWFWTPEEKAALLQAYTEARRVRFDAEVIAALTAQPTEREYGTQLAHGTVVGGYATPLRERMRLDASGNLGIGTITGGAP